MVDFSPPAPLSGTRIESLDIFRGCLLFLMIAANFLAGFNVVPYALKHSRVFGTLNFIDIGAALFLFTVGISLGLAFPISRSRQGTKVTLRRYVLRDLTLILFGITGSLLTSKGILRDWEIFQTIGLAGLIALPFVFLPSRWRFVAGVGLILVFQIIGSLGYWQWIKTADVGGLGGIPGGLAWAGIVLFGSSLSGLLRYDWQKFRSTSFIVGVLGIGVGLALTKFQPFDKRLVTGSYLALTTGIAALGAVVFGILTQRYGQKLLPLKILGMNPLVIFIIHGLAILAIEAFIPPVSTGGMVFFALAMLYAVCFAAALFLYRRKYFVRL